MNGIVVINKEKDFTSRDVINILNKKFNTKKIGHTGTLDPMATGVLVVCIGRYTKLVDKITSYDKEYIASIKFGVKTDTLDITGKILEKQENVVVDKCLLINILDSFLGYSIQEVPKYAAVKLNGKKLYEYARNNEEIKLPKREIEVKEIELLSMINDEVTFRVVVSKGTYIRSLIRDICEKLGVIGTMSSLHRTRQGNFSIDKSYYLQDIENKNYQLLTMEDLFSYPYYILNEEEYKKVKNGAFLELKEDYAFVFMQYKKEVIAIYKLEEKKYKPFFMV